MCTSHVFANHPSCSCNIPPSSAPPLPILLSNPNQLLPGRHLFEQCVCGELQGRTRVLVTHQLQYVAAADVIVVVDGGRIVDSGTYDELQAR